MWIYEPLLNSQKISAGLQLSMWLELLHHKRIAGRIGLYPRDIQLHGRQLQGYALAGTLGACDLLIEVA